MHTLMVIVGGFLLLAFGLLVARVTAGAAPGTAAGRVALVFIPVWLAAAGVNMWIGMHVAGYSAQAELPIFLLVFTVPAAVAAVLVEVARGSATATVDGRRRRLMAFSELDPSPINETIATLARRIHERFPHSGLSRVAAELVDVAGRNQQVIDELRRPLWWVRVLTVLAVSALLFLVVWAAFALYELSHGGRISLAEALQSLDAATSELIFLSIVVLFFVSLETRLKRRTALAMLHRLRSIAHVVDMHQLTKDPESVLRPVTMTASSPRRRITRAQLPRYLDYCSELLALTSKLAALHAQHLHDPVVLGAVNDIEALTADLSRKIWQKISILSMADFEHRELAILSRDASDGDASHAHSHG